MRQSELIERLITLSTCYTEFGLGAAESQLSEPLPDAAIELLQRIYREPPVTASRRSPDPRPDLPDTLWADLHTTLRAQGREILQDIQAAALAQPDNMQLAIVARVASDMYSSFVAAYNAGHKIETDFKRDYLALPPRLFPTGESPTQEETNIAWNNVRHEALLASPAVQDAIANLRDAVLPTWSWPMEAGDEVYDERPDRWAVLMNDYRADFPHATPDQLLDAIVIGERAAVYSFVSIYGARELSDKRIYQTVLSIFGLGTEDTSTELAGMCDMLNDSYNVSTGLNEARLHKQLAQHWPTVSLCSATAEVAGLEEASYLQDAREVLKELSVKLGDTDVSPEAKIRTGKELAALLAACGHRYHEPALIEAAEELYRAETTAQLQTIVRQPHIITAIDQAIPLAATHSVQAEELLRTASGQTEELSIKPPPLQRRARGGEEAIGHSELVTAEAAAHTYAQQHGTPVPASDAAPPAAEGTRPDASPSKPRAAVRSPGGSTRGQS